MLILPLRRWISAPVVDGEMLTTSCTNIITRLQGVGKRMSVLLASFSEVAWHF